LVRKAALDDVPEIYGLIESFAEKKIMLHRPLSEVYDKLRDFFVFDDGGAVAGTCSLHICSQEMGEIRSLTVKEDHTRRGIGRSLVNACLEEARSLGLKRVFALTYKTEFFHKLNFRTVSKDILPHKIWSDCIKCDRFPNCDETAVIIDLD